MPVPLDTFVQQLEDSGILDGETLTDFLPPKGELKNTEELARELVRLKMLTKFQAEELAKGKGKSLVLGNYLLMEKIGAGGMGQVFKARHRVMERLVAVKVLPPAMTKNKAAIARFHREVKAAAKASHPNIVTAHDADQANGVHFLVMEFVDGTDLSALVKKKGPLAVIKAVNCVLQAARGLEAAHKKGIVHRDMKPSNLLLDSEGTVKILDMGLARFSGENDTVQSELTSTGMVMGTVDYMAPEQAVDSKSADARADIYALGCSLHFLLTGKPTYEGDSLMNRMLAHRDRPIPSLRAARPEVPEQLETVFKKMVAKQVEGRYQTMTAVIVDLEQCSSGDEDTVVLPAPFAASNDATLTTFFNEIASKPTKTTPAMPIKKTPKRRPNDGRKKLVVIGTGLFGIVMLTVTIIFLSGKDSTHRQKEKDGSTEVAKDVKTKSSDKTESRAKRPTVPEKALAMSPAFVVDASQKALAHESPGFKQWMKDVAAMPVENQAEAVSKKLQELNPGFDPKKVMHTIEKKVVTRFEFDTSNVTDISPVRALAGLKRLVCSGGGGDKGVLSDVSPLEGMNLTMIVFNPNRITRGMNLIRQMKSLKTIGIGSETIGIGLDGDGALFSPDEFWKKYDAGVFGTPRPQ